MVYIVFITNKLESYYAIIPIMLFVQLLAKPTYFAGFYAVPFQVTTVYQKLLLHLS